VAINDDALGVLEGSQIKILSKMILQRSLYDAMEERSKVEQDFQEYRLDIKQKGTTRTRKVDTPDE